MFDDIIIYESIISLNSLASNYDLALASIGKHENIVSPMHMAMLFGAIANGGQIVPLKLIKEIEDIKLNDKKVKIQKSFGYAIAEKIDEILEENVLTGSAEDAKVEGYIICGMSADVDTDILKNPMLSWFAGYIKDSNNPYAIAIVLEDYNENIDELEKISSKILEEIINSNKE